MNYFWYYLVFVLLLSFVLSSPTHNLSPNRNENAPLEPSASGDEEPSTLAQFEKSKDLSAQETFYPIGGVWWGIRPWGGWGGYRPWYGWHNPHWGGHWGGPWGGHWGGGRWRR